MTVSPVGTKPHFSMTRPLAGLSTKCPDIRDLMHLTADQCMELEREIAFTIQIGERILQERGLPVFFQI